MWNQCTCILTKQRILFSRTTGGVYQGGDADSKQTTASIRTVDEDMDTASIDTAKARDKYVEMGGRRLLKHGTMGKILRVP